MELLFCPFGQENVFTNPFAQNYSMTALEKVLKNGVNGTEASEDGSAVTQKRKEVIIRGVLSITVISAEDLPAVDLMGKADPFVVLTMKKSETKNKTRVKASFLMRLNFLWSEIGFP